MLKDLELDKLLNQIRDEYNAWFDYVNPKRIQYRERILKYDNQSKRKDKINIHLIANTIDALLWVSYTDALTVKFIPRDWFIWQEEADKLNYVAQFDWEEEDYQQLYYQKEQDRYFFGVWIRVRTGWDDVTKTPIFNTINPLSWIPDPLPSQTGKYNWQNYRFHWFEMITTMYDLINEWIYDKKWLDKLVANKFSDEQDNTKQSYDTAGWFNTNCWNLKENFSLWIYHHYTIFEWEKYLVTTDADRKEILRAEPIKKVLKEEKKSDGKVRRPIILNYYEPMRNNPFGISICDRLEDKQNAKSILFNLNIIKAKKEAFGWDYLVNSRLIKNRQYLTTPTVDSKYIPVNTAEPLSNAIMEVPRSNIKTDTIEWLSMLDKETQLDTWLDMQQLGIRWDRSITASESQTIQANANIKNILKNRINAWWDKDFWKEWYKGYQENLSNADEKFITLNNDFEYSSLTMRKDEFVTENSPFVMVWTRTDVEALDERKKQYMNAMLPIITQDATIPEVSKSFAKRYTYRLNGMTPNQVNVLVPISPAERKAKQFMNMLNLNIIPKSLFADPNTDYQTYWVYFNKAQNTDAKIKTLQVLEKAMIEMWLWQPQSWPWNMEQISNSSANLQMSKNIQQEWQQVISRWQ